MNLKQLLIRGAYRLGYRRCVIATLDLPPALPAARTDLRLAPLPLEAALAQAPSSDPALRATYEGRQARGDRAWGLWRGSTLVSQGWSSIRPVHVTRNFILAPGPLETYLYDFYTPPAHRGQAHYPALLQALCAALGAEGQRRAWIVVFSSNPASLRGIEKAGFRPAARYELLAGWFACLRLHPGQPRPNVKLARFGWQVPRRASRPSPAGAGHRP